METCRTCAKCDFENEHNWLDLFHPTCWEQEIEQIRMEFSNWKLQISKNDGLPQKICTDCFSKFCTVYTFRLACQEAQQKLSNIFDKIDDESQSLPSDDCGTGLRKMVNIDNETKNVHMDICHDDGTEILLKYDGRRYHRRCTLMENANTQTDFIMEVSATTTTIKTTTTAPKYTAISLSEYSQHNNENTPPTIARQKQKRQTTTATILLGTIIEKVPEHQAHQVPIKVHDQFIEETANDQLVKDEEDEEHPQLIEGDNSLVDDLVEGIIETFQPFPATADLTNYVQCCAELETHAQIQPDADLNAVTEEVELEGDRELDASTAALKISFVFECKYCYKSKDTTINIDTNNTTPITKTNNANHFLTQDALLRHITESHDPDYPFDCPYCEKHFQDAASRTVHIKDQHVEKHFNCSVCGKRYADKCNLRHHIEKYHSETDFECALCEKRFYSRKSLNYHMKWHNPDRQLKCGYCDRLFINQRHLKCHEATHTGIRNSEYCTFCGKAFIHLKTLRWHIYRQHGGEKPVKCGSCTEVFASYLDKRIHMLEHHLENLTTIERTECVRCHKRYENETDLKEHMTEHHKTAEKPTLVISNNKRVLQTKQQKRYTGIFQCEVCAASFNMKSALERHAAVHSPTGRPHACPQCPKRFKRAQDMNWHMKTHSNEKPNVCDICGKGFALKYVLTQHRRSHEVLEKNFTCATCGKSYLFEKSLRLHERQHTGKTYYKCDLCGENFVTHIKFKSHMRKMHEQSNM